MTCPICKHGEIAPGHTTIAIQRAESAIILKGVPADICDNCEEYHLSEDVQGGRSRKVHYRLMGGLLPDQLRIVVLNFPRCSPFPPTQRTRAGGVTLLLLRPS
jgi:YgiT-type zinc finger domain-containing protein